MQVLVSDTSVLIDPERGKLVESCFRPAHRFAVPDVLYERELKDYGGPELIGQGLEIVESSGAVSTLATQYARRLRALSTPDAFAVALAKTHGWQLLTGDDVLRNLAADEQVDCHGVLWVFDQLYAAKLAQPRMLHEALTTLGEHPRCRLPGSEIQRRLKVYLSAGRQ